MVSRWAPPTENDTQAYIRFVSEKTGIPSDRKITLQDNPEEMKRVISAMIEMEGGQEAANYFNSRIVDRGVSLALSSQASDNPADSSINSNISAENIPAQGTEDIVTTASQAIASSATTQESPRPVASPLGNVGPRPDDESRGAAWDTLYGGTHDPETGQLIQGG